MLSVLIKKLKRSRKVKDTVVATTKKKEDNKITNFCRTNSIQFFRGSKNDVLNRYYETAKKVKADIVVRITADCPLIDPQLVDECIKGFKNYDIDYFSNTNPRSFPDGLDVSVMSFKSIKRAYCEAKSLYDREHVTSFIINSENFSKRFLKNKKDLSKIRWTVDNQKDLDTVSNIFKHFSPNIHFSWLDVLKLNQTKKNLFLNNLK